MIEMDLVAATQVSLRRFSEICMPPRKLSVNSADNAFVIFYAS